MTDRRFNWAQFLTTLVVTFFAIHGFLSIVAETTILRSAELTLISLVVAGLAALVFRRRSGSA
jgi:hypothetical protein